jgi:hypothetical protein
VRSSWRRVFESGEGRDFKTDQNFIRSCQPATTAKAKAGPSWTCSATRRFRVECGCVMAPSRWSPFQTLARLVYRRPVLVYCLALLVPALLAIGVVRLGGFGNEAC